VDSIISGYTRYLLEVSLTVTIPVELNPGR
jgi:hypothetical protein